MSSVSYAVYSAELKSLLFEVQDASGALNKSKATNNVFSYVVSHKDVLRYEVTNANANANEARKNSLRKFYELIVNKSFEIRDSLYKYNIRDNESYDLCDKVYMFAKGDLIKYFNYSEDNALFYQPLQFQVRRSARIAAKHNHVSAIKPGGDYPYPSVQSANIVLYENPYEKLPSLRRSARIAAKAAKV